MSPELTVAQYLDAPVEEDVWHPELMARMDHFSPSSLSMLRRCPRQFQERYIHGRKERPAEAPIVGNAVHAGLERNFSQKIASFADLPARELLAWFMDEGFIRTCVEEQESSGFEIRWDSDPEQARKRGQAMLGGYHREVSPRIQPLAVESAISVDYGLPVPIIGRFDVEKHDSVLDIKTGKRSKRKPDESWRIQAAVYGESQGKPVEFHSVTASPSGSVTIVTPLESEALLVQPTAIEREEIRRTVKAIAAEASFYMALYGPDETWPTHGRFHTWACDYCGFRRDPCPAWDEI